MDPMAGVSVLCAGSGPEVGAAADLLTLLGADALRVDHLDASAVERLDVDGAIGRLPSGATPPWPVVDVGDAETDRSWIERGLAVLTDPACVPDGPLAARLNGAAAVVRLLAAARGEAVALDGPALLGERASVAGLGRAANSSAGGSAVMVRSADGWLAVNLARDDDVSALPALVGAHVDPGDWPAVQRLLGERTTAELTETGALLGLALAPVESPDEDAALLARGQAPVRAPFLVDGRRPGRSSLRPTTAVPEPVPEPLVVELASLWAGPLCGSLLLDAGCQVVKVESNVRPDGVRRGPAAFHERLNAGKESVAVDLGDQADVAFLAALLASADVVIEGSRPRVLDDLAIGPSTAGRSHRVWVSITGYGRTGPWSNRVAFGDDAAVAGGLYDDSGSAPRFVLDAAADPVSGLYAAAAALAGLVSGRGHQIDLAMREAVAYACGPRTRWIAVDAPSAVPAPSPDARRNLPLADLGAHTEHWRQRLRTAQEQTTSGRSDHDETMEKP